MALLIKSMRLDAFKSYELVVLSFDKKFNVIIGENNIGKTTIFEAMLLWKKCYDLNIKGNKVEFYKRSNNIYVNFEELHFIRLSQDTDIFNGKKNTCTISLELFDKETNLSFNLGFTLTKPQNIPNAYIRCTMINEEEFVKFQDHYKNKNIKLDNLIYIHQTRPVSNVLSNEPYMYKGQVIKKIEKGKSNEVLRNKIITSITSNKERLENYMKNVLGVEFSFVLPKRGKRDQDEYIDLKVRIDGKDLDIFLQGSGFLQVAEIFSTIDTFDNELNVLLIDEPDSHINARIQDKLLAELQNIENTQIFVISHNDNFVSNLKSNQIIFINADNKSNSDISCLEEIDFDKIHYAMGGVISSLTLLQKSDKIIFVEGDDDIEYIKAIYKKTTELGIIEEILSEASNLQYINFEKIAFWYMRGKDYLPIKVTNCKNLISQLIKEKEYSILFDKDFCTIDSNNLFSKDIEKRLGKKSKSYVHNGYCFESVLFSDNDILANLIHRISGVNIGEVKDFILDYRTLIQDELKDVSSDRYKEMKFKFTGQKKESRSELDKVDFDSFAAECSKDYQYAMNKDNIKEFVIKFENQKGIKLFNRNDEESDTYASGLLKLYINAVESINDLYSSYKNLLKFILQKNSN